MSRRRILEKNRKTFAIYRLPMTIEKNKNTPEIILGGVSL